MRGPVTGSTARLRGARAQQETQPRGVFHTVQEFLWAILEKLSPARRVLLLLGMVFLIFPSGGVQPSGEIGRSGGGRSSISFLWRGLPVHPADARDLGPGSDEARPGNRARYPELAVAFNSASGARAGASPSPPVRRTPWPEITTTSSPGPQPVPGETRFLLAVADVAGKSIPAALLMATFQASLKTLSAIPCSWPNWSRE